MLKVDVGEWLISHVDAKQTAGEPAEGHGVRPGPPVYSAHVASAYSQSYSHSHARVGLRRALFCTSFIIVLIIRERMTTRKVMRIDLNDLL